MLEGRQKAINVPSLMSPATAWFTSRMESWCAGRDEGQCSLSTPSPPSPLRNATQSPEIRHASQLQSHRKKKKKTEDIIGVLIMIDSFIPLLDTAAERADVEECYHWLANVKIWKKCTHLNHRIRLTAKAPWNGSESLKRRRTRFSNSPQCAFKHRSRFLDDYEIQQHYEQHRKQISEHVHKEKQKKNCHFVNCMVKLQVI